MKHLDPLCNPWSEINFHALECLEELITNKSIENYLSCESLHLIKDIIFKIASQLPYQNDNKLYYSKVCDLIYILYNKHKLYY